MTTTAPADPRPWHEENPARLDWELEQFADRGLPAETTMGLVDGRHANDLVIRTQLPFRGEQVPVEVAFPFDYPLDHPTVYGPPGLLERHQQPIEGNFCWAEDPDREWTTDMFAAELVDVDVRDLLKDTEKGEDAVHAGEANMSEPLTGLIGLSAGVVVVPDPYLAENLADREGKMTLRKARGAHFLAEAHGLGDADPVADEYMRVAGEDLTLPGRWLAVEPPPSPEVFKDSEALIQYIDEQTEHPLRRLRRQLKEHQSRDVALEWLELTFMEEGPRRVEFRRNWVFLALALKRGDSPEVVGKFQAQALNRAERQRRIPELIGLDEVSALVVGGGSVGGGLALELARAGVGTLDIVDYDHVDVNNAVRHALSPNMAGDKKARWLQVRAAAQNPFIDVRSHDLIIGSGADAASQLRELVANASVVVDTTASNPVARILQRECQRTGVPLVVAGLTAGNYGYELVTVSAAGTPCFECFLRHQRDGAVPAAEAAPPEPGVTPIGCSHPAFAGAGFDAAELSAAAARAVVQATGASEYPAARGDWRIRNFRAEPALATGQLTVHDGCPGCSK